MSETKVLPAQRVHERIRLDILKGTWPPGQKMQPGHLSGVYETSTTVVREALTRLAGEKLIVIERNRGFFVQHLSDEELRDLTDVRCHIEVLALEMAIQRGDLLWETELNASHYRLSRTPRHDEGFPDSVADDWAQAHRNFHAKLIEACGVPALIDFARQLSDTTELYRHRATVARWAANRSLEDEHLEILEATLARDTERASRLLTRHYQRTLEVILEGASGQPIDSA